MLPRNHGLPGPRAVPVVTCIAAIALAGVVLHAAEDKWIEMKSAHFTVVSNAGEGSTRTIVWQLEQIRSVLAALWPWARVDLNRPLTTIVVKDEGNMRTLVPEYWERKNDVHPASVWGSGLDGPYVAIRTDLHVDDRTMLNPHLTVFQSYASLVLQSSMTRQLPTWLQRGLPSVLSNTIVRDNFVLIGAPIPWHLQRLRSGFRMPLADVFAVTRSSPVFTSADRLEQFDAQAWGLVHFLMFGQDGQLRERLDRFIRLILQGTDAAAAQLESLGRVQDLETPLQIYVNHQLFPYAKAELDVSVKREAFGFRPIASGDSAAARAGFRLATGHAEDARALIAAGRQSDATNTALYVSEGMLLENTGKYAEAQAAFAKAVEGGTTSAHAHYRLAVLELRTRPDRERLAAIEKTLTRAIALNDRLAPAYAYLADVRAILDPKGAGALPAIRRAIALEPAESFYHQVAARVLWGMDRRDEARVEAQTAVDLAASDDQRAAAHELVRRMAG